MHTQQRNDLNINYIDPQDLLLWGDSSFNYPGLPAFPIPDAQELDQTQFFTEAWVYDVSSQLHTTELKSPLAQESDEDHMHLLVPPPVIPPPQCTRAHKFDTGEDSATQSLLFPCTVNNTSAAISNSPPTATRQVSVPANNRAGVEKNQMFPCRVPGCRSTFKGRPGLRRHQKTVHAQQIQQYPDLICPTLLLVPGTERFDCPVMGCDRKGERAMSRRDNLRAHMRNVHEIRIAKRNRVKDKDVASQTDTATSPESSSSSPSTPEVS